MALFAVETLLALGHLIINILRLVCTVPGSICVFCKGRKKENHNMEKFVFFQQTSNAA